MKNLFDLQGSVALVTGGGQGLGRAISEGLAAYGAAVSVVDIDRAAAQQVTETIGKAGGQASPVQCDVSQQDQAEAAVQQTLASFGKIDVLVANAGIGDRSPAETMTIQQWDRVIGINLRGVWLFDQAVGKHMLERRSGSIINMASIAGQVGLTTGNANYAASKGGVIALTRCLAIEWATRGIRVNAIAPTHFKTPLVASAIERNPATLDYFLGNIPMGRLGEPQEIVGAAVFLASSASSMVTGHVLNVDGGHTAR
jgi:NAD(P)-dependent dehydrogenase (short-subunit alcohol dehydrogenase family)